MPILRTCCFNVGYFKLGDESSNVKPKGFIPYLINVEMSISKRIELVFISWWKDLWDSDNKNSITYLVSSKFVQKKIYVNFINMINESMLMGPHDFYHSVIKTGELAVVTSIKSGSKSRFLLALEFMMTAPGRHGNFLNAPSILINLLIVLPIVIICRKLIDSKFDSLPARILATPFKFLAYMLLGVAQLLFGVSKFLSFMTLPLTKALTAMSQYAMPDRVKRYKINSRAVLGALVLSTLIIALSFISFGAGAILLAPLFSWLSASIGTGWMIALLPAILTVSVMGLNALFTTCAAIGRYCLNLKNSLADWLSAESKVKKLTLIERVRERLLNAKEELARVLSDKPMSVPVCVNLSYFLKEHQYLRKVINLMKLRSRMEDYADRINRFRKDGDKRAIYDEFMEVNLAVHSALANLLEFANKENIEFILSEMLLLLHYIEEHSEQFSGRDADPIRDVLYDLQKFAEQMDSDKAQATIEQIEQFFSEGRFTAYKKQWREQSSHRKQSQKTDSSVSTVTKDTFFNDSPKMEEQENQAQEQNKFAVELAKLTDEEPSFDDTDVSASSTFASANAVPRATRE